MDLLNATKMQAGYTMGMQPDGREFLVVAVKGTFTLPKNGEEAQLSDEQVPLVEADVSTGEPGFSATLYESDYALRKSRCDVLLNGSAYAPKGKPATKVPVSLKVGSLSKTFYVVGDRFWKKGFFSIRASWPRPFTVMLISYDKAFGGSDNTHKKPANHKAHMLNPIGVGFHSNLKKEFIQGKHLPNTEVPKRPVKNPTGKYRPVAFGVIGRGWEPRYKLAGTYDQNWVDNVFPFLPSDFKDAYYQAAPLDQQVDYLRGGEEVVLQNLTPDGFTRFQIPQVQVPVAFFLKKGETQKTNAVADTLVLEPNEGRFTITWRVSIPLKKNMFEVVQVLAGKMPRGWWRARESGKTYYRSLDELVKERRREAEEEMV
jgi:hypothetical protein